MYYLPSKKSFFGFSFLKRRIPSSVLSVEISDQVIRFVVLKKTGDVQSPYTIVSFGTKEVPAGAIIGGVVRNTDVVVDVLKDIRRQTKIQDIFLIFPESYGHTVTLSVSGKKEQLIKEVIKGQIEEQLPSAITKTVFYYEVLHKHTKNTDVLVRIIPTEILKTYRGLCKLAQCKLVGVECISDALARLLTTPQEVATILSIHIGAQETTCALVAQGKVQNSVVLSVGGNALLQALQQTEGLTVAKVSKSKKEKGYLRHKGSKELLYSVASLLDKITNAIGTLAKDWQAQVSHLNHIRPVEQVVLSGAEVNHIGIENYIASNVVFPVSLANIWRTFYNFDQTIPKINFEESLVYAPVIGLAVGRLSQKK
jgi:Tfp pilus assembly PilM family ATPase